jgi:hypothetical protein
MAAFGAIAALIVMLRHRRTEPDLRRLACQIETHRPELDGRLLTAVQQIAPPGSALGYLQERVVAEALHHGRQTDWAEAVPFSRVVVSHLAHLMALAAFVISLWGLRAPANHGGRLIVRTGPGLTVTPGDTSIERGNSLVVLARFSGPLPPGVDLVLEPSLDGPRRVPMTKSLADPVFGGTIPEVTNDFRYHLEYAAQRTRDFQVSVFEHPKLERADAELTYPAYTAKTPKRIEDTRRISAVEGSRLDLFLQLNKPVASARLVAKDKDRHIISLSVETNRAVAALRQFPLETSRTYELQLTDADRRTNKVPAQFVFNVLKNRTPEIQLTSPHGDLRPSALEELSFEGTVWDDFGVAAYGLAYSIAGQETRFIELGQSVPAQEKRPFQYLLCLEDLSLQPDQFISWFVWADDTGPDGQVRRTTGDLFFAEVRPFDEIFREGEASQSEQDASDDPSGQAGNQTARLAELQKQIISATWKLQRDRGVAPQPNPSPGNGASQETKPRTEIKRPSSLSLARMSPLERGPSAAPEAQITSRTLARSPLARATQNNLDLIVAPTPQVAGQPSGRGRSRAAARPPEPAARRANPPSQDQPSQYENDAAVVRDSQEHALEMARSALERQQDPRAAALWTAATSEMEKALAKLKEAVRSPRALPEALAPEQAAYQALLKLQQHEYEVSRSRNRSQGLGSRQQQMRQQLDQLDLTQSENRYETQRQAQAPQTQQRREQLQVMNRLQELARRQQDVNDRLKELQAAIQEARTDVEREDIRRRLKRLQEQEQRVLADLDELRQRMDRPENQSSMAEPRRQLDQTRDDLQRAAEAAAQGSATQALASGTRAQRQLQQIHDNLRKDSSSAFSQDLRQMRSDARELSRKQDEIHKNLDAFAEAQRKTLDDADARKSLLDQLGQQSERLTNLIERAAQVSQQAEEAEPVMSRELYDALREFSQGDADNVKRLQQELIDEGLLTRTMYERFKDISRAGGARSLELTAELLRQSYFPHANEAEERARLGIDNLRRGVERAAEKVLGDDTQSLRLARQELDELTDQVEREMAQAEGNETNQLRLASTLPRQPPATESAPGPDTQARNNLSPQRSGPPTQAQSQEEPGPPNQPASPQNRGRTSANGQPIAPTAGVAHPQAAPNSQSPGNREGQPGPLTPAGQERQSLPAQGQPGGGGGGAPFAPDFDRLVGGNGAWWAGPITGPDFAPWSDRLREVEELVDMADMRNRLAQAREWARLLRQGFKRDLKKPDWAVVRLHVINPLVEVRNQISEELARRQPTDQLAPIDRDPVPTRYSELVRRYYEVLGRDR